MSMIDSVAVFSKKLEDLFLWDHVDAFNRLGWTTMGSFTFAADYIPGKSDGEVFMEKIIKRLLGEGQEDNPCVAQIRRLHFECYSAYIGEMQRKTLPEDLHRRRMLPAAERAFRLWELDCSLTGVSFKGELEPSDELVNKFVTMQETGVLHHIPWMHFGRKDHEVEGQSVDTYFKTDAISGLLKQHTVGSTTEADLNSDYRLHKALQRRGVAMHIARLLDYSAHELLVTWYIEEYNTEPLYGHHKVSMDQLLRVDKAIFVRLAKITSAGLGLNLDGSFPLDGPLQGVMEENKIQMIMNPLAITGGGATASSRAQPEQRGEKRELERLKAEVKALKANRKDTPTKGKAKGNGKKDKKKSEFVRMPKEIIGMESLHRGRKICFGYNMQIGCKESIDSERNCSRGKHVCARKGCGGDHPQHSSRCPQR